MRSEPPRCTTCREPTVSACGPATRARTPRTDFEDPDLLGHAYVGAYIVGEPDRALVVQGPEGVAGYCLAAADTRAFEAWCETSWWPILRQRYPVADGDSADAEMIGLFHAPPRASDAVVDAYPAHLHIDLLASARGAGLGRRLVERQLADLRRVGSPGVHLDVATDQRQRHRVLPAPRVRRRRAARVVDDHGPAARLSRPTTSRTWRLGGLGRHARRRARARSSPSGPRRPCR